jgi:methyltransferase-like protein/SAM-dependent methyltransferase
MQLFSPCVTHAKEALNMPSTSAPDKTSYDEVPYKSYPYRQTHPERLATIATLFGMAVKPIEECRVLEIGCAAGGNILPMADRFPNSQFIGIDLSSRQLRDGQAVVDELGIKNVRLIHSDIRQLDPQLGKFDYIVCHGVYSWIPDDAQEALLAACARHLAPQGVAYISYNTFPGWHMRGMIRDIMYFRARRFSKPEDRVRQARGLLHFLAESVPVADNPYGLLLNKELNLLQDKADYYLLHEHLEEHNEPIYFYEFAERTRTFKLQYLAEADFSVMAVENFPPKIEAMLQNVASDLIEIEQYMDFVRNRMFRQTLLCHDDVLLDRRLSPERMRGMHVASSTRPEQEITNLHDGQQVTFRTQGSVTTTTDPVMKAALLHLGKRWPEYVPFTELYAVARSQASGGPALVDTVRTSHEAAQLAKPLMRCYATGHVDLSIAPPKFCNSVSDRPVARPFARYLAKHGSEVTSQRHETVRLDDIDQHLLANLDGSNSVATLANYLVDLISQGVVIVHDDGRPISDAAEIERIAIDSVEKRLKNLARQALLVG